MPVSHFERARELHLAAINHRLGLMRQALAAKVGAEQLAAISTEIANMSDRSGGAVNTRIGRPATPVREAWLSDSVPAWKALFAARRDLRAEFGGDADVFCGFMRSAFDTYFAEEL